MGMIIRVAYNNRKWAGKCTGIDVNDKKSPFIKCTKRIINTKEKDEVFKVDNSGNCMPMDNGEINCGEEKLCIDYVWTGYSGKFDVKRTIGNVFFVFPAYDNSLVLFAKSRVKAVDGGRVYFEKFEPMAKENWVRDLSAKDILGKVWGQGTYRFIGSEEEKCLDEKIKRKKDTDISVGDSIRVKAGVMDPDFTDDIGGWQGRISEVEDDMVLIEWDSLTIKNMNFYRIVKSENQELAWECMWLYKDDVILSSPRDKKSDVSRILTSLNNEIRKLRGKILRNIIIGVGVVTVWSWLAQSGKARII